MEKKKIKTVAEKFGIGANTARKYIHMTETQIQRLDQPRACDKKASPMNEWLNVIFKMMQDGHSDETIYFYIKYHPAFRASLSGLQRYLYCIGKNNFPKRRPFHYKYLRERVLPEDVICLKRTEIIKHILTCNPKTKKEERLDRYMEIIKEKYPVLAWGEEAFKEFHGIMMGDDPEKIESFLALYKESAIKTFCIGIERDIVPVKNAISLPESSGFVEGNNNKFKLIKRIVYGRSGLVNLSKKCKLAFLPKKEPFHILDLV